MAFRRSDTSIDRLGPLPAQSAPALLIASCITPRCVTPATPKRVARVVPDEDCPPKGKPRLTL